MEWLPVKCQCKSEHCEYYGLNVGTFYNGCGWDNEADAWKAAAAPEMYEALKNLENDNGQIPEHAWQMVQDAIKKAEGLKDE